MFHGSSWRMSWPCNTSVTRSHHNSHDLTLKRFPDTTATPLFWNERSGELVAVSHWCSAFFTFIVTWGECFSKASLSTFWTVDVCVRLQVDECGCQCVWLGSVWLLKKGNPFFFFFLFLFWRPSWQRATPSRTDPRICSLAPNQGQAERLSSTPSAPIVFLSFCSWTQHLFSFFQTMNKSKNLKHGCQN